jgi:hypothetical protein
MRTDTQTLTYKEGAALAGFSLRQFKRKTREWGLIPVGFTGNRPLFLREAIESAKQAETNRRISAYANASNPAPARVLSLREIRRQAAKGKGGK